jgi:hypothetical protein
VKIMQPTPDPTPSLTVLKRLQLGVVPKTPVARSCATSPPHSSLPTPHQGHKGQSQLPSLRSRGCRDRRLLRNLVSQRRATTLHLFKLNIIYTAPNGQRLEKSTTFLTPSWK